MAKPLEDQVVEGIQHAAGLYHRLVLVVAPAGAGKTVALQNVRDGIAAPLLNVNLQLSRCLLDLDRRRRALQVPQSLREIVSQAGAGVVLLDNTEMLFDVSLKQDPLRLLQGLSRNRTVVAAWSGLVEGGYLVYAAPDHPEHRRYPASGLLIVTPDTAS